MLIGAASVAYSGARLWVLAGFFPSFADQADNPLVECAISFVAILLIAIYFIFKAERDAKRRIYVDRCIKCGYDLRGSPNRCAECGAPKNVAGGTEGDTTGTQRKH